MNTVEVTFNWRRAYSTQRRKQEPEAVTIMTAHVPRQGDAVDISIPVGPRENARRCGTAQRVEWYYRKGKTFVLVTVS